MIHSSSYNVTRSDGTENLITSPKPGFYMPRTQWIENVAEGSQLLRVTLSCSFSDQRRYAQPSSSSYHILQSTCRRPRYVSCAYQKRLLIGTERYEERNSQSESSVWRRAKILHTRTPEHQRYHVCHVIRIAIFGLVLIRYHVAAFQAQLVSSFMFSKIHRLTLLLF